MIEIANPVKESDTLKLAAAIDQSLTADRATTVAIMSDGDILIARHHGRALVSQLGFSSAEAILVATVVSELARNILLYAKEGEIILKALENQGRHGVLIIARDDGPGISDVQQAAIASYSNSGSLRLGLCGLKRLVDEFEIVSTVGKGTTVAITKWKA